MISVYCWRKDQKKGVWLKPEELRDNAVSLQVGHDVVWIDLEAPSEEEEQLVFLSFMPVHTLTLEDMTRPRREGGAHFPKVEEFHDYLFVIVNPLDERFWGKAPRGGPPSAAWAPANAIGIRQAPDREAPSLPPEKSAASERRPDDESGRHVTATQLSAVLTRKLLITHHVQALHGISQLRGFLSRHETLADRGPDYLFHLILDAMVDQYAPVLDHFDEALEGMETEILNQPGQQLLSRLLGLKRQIIALRKTLVYEREVLARLARGEFDLIDEREMVYYRNVYDHLVRFTELAESSRDMVSDLTQTQLAAVSNKLNEIMKVLTMISTIVLPMTLVAGIYGMNFTLLPQVEEPWGFPMALGLMLLTGFGALAFFRWRGWI